MRVSCARAQAIELLHLPAMARAGADAEDQPPVRDDVDGGRHLGEDGRPPVSVARDEGSQPDPVGDRGETSECGPALERVVIPIL